MKESDIIFFMLFILVPVMLSLPKKQEKQNKEMNSTNDGNGVKLVVAKFQINIINTIEEPATWQSRA